MKVSVSTYKFVNFLHKNTVSFNSSKKSNQNKNKTEFLPPEISLKTEIQANQQKEKFFFNYFLKKSGKVTKEEYFDILKNHPLTLIEAEKLSDIPEVQTTPEIVAKAAICLKKYFDEKFENYRVISIGTSPAIICEVLNFLNSQVIFMPASGLADFDKTKRNFLKNADKNESIYENVLKISDYLKEKGVTNNDKKTNILIDYTASGKSLKNAGAILKEFNCIDSSKIYLCSIINCLKRASKNEDGLTRNEIYSLKIDMEETQIEIISNTPHFYINDSVNGFFDHCIIAKDKTNEELFQEFENYSQPDARAFSLSAIHETQKKSGNSPD